MSLAPAVEQLTEPAAWRFQSRSRGRTRRGFSSAFLLRRRIITNETKSRNLPLVARVRLGLVVLAEFPMTPLTGPYVSPEIYRKSPRKIFFVDWIRSPIAQFVEAGSHPS